MKLQADVSIRDNAGSTPLHIAARNGHADVVSFLLTQPGINPVSGKLRTMAASIIIHVSNCALFLHVGMQIRGHTRGLD